MRKRIVIDGDGVLISYNHAYPYVWKKAFGVELKEIKPGCYHAANQFGVQFRSPEERAKFFEHFDEEAWESMPAMPGAVAACHALHRSDFELICVSSMPPQFRNARVRNFSKLGLPIADVIATDRKSSANPKLDAIRKISPVAVVDDLASNFLGVENLHKALINPAQEDSPNDEEGILLADSVHNSLKEFAAFWLSRT